MPNYFNPYGYNGNPMPFNNQSYGNNPNPQYNPPQYPPQPQQPFNPTMIWVDGEAAARAYQIPPTHPAGQPIALWDNNEMVIYLKQVDSFGRPTPLKKVYYRIGDDQVSGNLPIPNGQSGSTEQQVDTSKFVTKDDFESLKNELRTMMQGQGQNQNSNQNRSERGGRQ